MNKIINNVLVWIGTIGMSRNNQSIINVDILE